MPKSIATCTVYIHHICTIARDGVWLWTDQECTLMQSGAVYYFHNFFPNCISNKGSILAYSHNYGGWFWNHTSHIYVAVLEGYCYCPRMNNKKIVSHCTTYCPVASYRVPFSFQPSLRGEIEAGDVWWSKPWASTTQNITHAKLFPG